MASFNKFNKFVEDCAHGVHVLNSNQLVVALTNTAPTASNSVLADITEISYTNCSSRNITTTSSAQTSGLYKLILSDLTLTASGGSVGPFKYVVVYNDTPTSPANPLIGWYEHTATVTMAAGESFTIDFNVNGLFNLQ